MARVVLAALPAPVEPELLRQHQRVAVRVVEGGELGRVGDFDGRAVECHARCLQPGALSLAIGDLKAGQIIDVRRLTARSHPSYHLSDWALAYRSAGLVINVQINGFLGA